MKLLLCPRCTDVRKLGRERTACSCGRSWGRYLDNDMAIVGGAAKIIWLANPDIRKWLVEGAKPGQRLDCWVYDERGSRSHVVREEEWGGFA